MATLAKRPRAHGLFAALRLLQRWYQRAAGLTPEEAMGRLRFRSSVALHYSGSEVEAITDWTPEGPDTSGRLPAPQPLDPGRLPLGVEITPAAFGFLGANGTLPSFYTEIFNKRDAELRERTGRGDQAPRAFMDIFLQRAALLFYRGWLKNRLALQYELDRRERFLPLVLALAGLGEPGLRNRLRAADGGVADESLAYHAGALATRPVSAAALRGVLGHYFGVAVQVHELLGRHIQVPPDQRSLLGMSRSTLGREALLGGRVWQRDLRIGLTLGPLPRASFDAFLPGGTAALALSELLRLMLGDAFEVDVRLMRAAPDVRPAVLGTAQPERLEQQGIPKPWVAALGTVQPARLGWDSVLVTRQADAPRTDTGYELFVVN
ncbi:MAG: type VI secretion system baseplate subunit TssG [Rubrivivax sp.]